MMIQEHDEIVDIPRNRIRYFGGTGKMLLPSPGTIANIIKRIPKSKLLTTDLLRQELTDQFHVKGTCPVTTKKSLQALVNDPGTNVAYWRVIRPRPARSWRPIPAVSKAMPPICKMKASSLIPKAKMPK